MLKARKPSQPQPQQLLVEGDNDRHVIWALCAQHQLSQTFSVEVPLQDKGEGIERLLAGLPLKLREENLRTLGIVIDADLDPGLASRWEAVRNKLTASGYFEHSQITAS